jgi:hypothetical protein
LNAENLNGSRWISVKYSGEFFYNKKTKSSGTEIILIGLFSKTSEITSIENVNRVPGAINSGRDYKTAETLFSELPTDISEDFLIMYPLENIIEVPSDANFLFLCIADIYYPDNSGSINITITSLQELEVIFSIENLIIILELGFIFFVLIYYLKKIAGYQTFS